MFELQYTSINLILLNITRLLGIDPNSLFGDKSWLFKTLASGEHQAGIAGVDVHFFMADSRQKQRKTSQALSSNSICCCLTLCCSCGPLVQEPHMLRTFPWLAKP
jgi:hypothetical protein